MAIDQIISTFKEADYTEIEKLAEENTAPRDIARAMRVPVKDFMFLWRDKTSLVRQAYDLGRLQIDIKKGEVLHKMVQSENVTAFQIHEKKSKERDFEDIKSDIFGFY